MSQKFITVRLDRATLVKLHAAAKRRHLRPSAVALLALQKWLDAAEAAIRVRPYEQVKNLIGCVNGSDPHRSTRSARALAEGLRKDTIAAHPVDAIFGHLRLDTSVDAVLEKMRGPRRPRRRRPVGKR